MRYMIIMYIPYSVNLYHTRDTTCVILNNLYLYKNKY